MIASVSSSLRLHAKTASALARAAASSPQRVAGRRWLSIHEHQSMGLLNQYGVATPKSVPAHSAQEAFDVAKKHFADAKHGMVIKAQVLAGGRGKGHFDSGLQGGVHLIKTAEEARDYASKMIGNKLITKQTGAAGRVCNAVMLAEARPPAHEYYVALLNDRASQLPTMIASNQGGMSIEDVAKENPEAIVTTSIDFERGLDQASALSIAKKLGFSGDEQTKQAADTFVKLYKLFKDTDATQVEINPMAETKDGEVLCMDAKLGFDDNADFRQEAIFKLRDVSQEDPDEVEAAKSGLNFIKLDGSIGCLVNGAGLAMATMDCLKLAGGDPANFLDCGGGANEASIKTAFTLLLRSPNVKAIFVNIFGGIVRADLIAQGIVNAATDMDVKVPIVCRLQGTNFEKAKEIIDGFKNPSVRIESYVGLDEAASAAVKAAQAA